MSNKNSTGYWELMHSSFWITLNANDFFGPFAYGLELSEEDLHWAVPIAEKYEQDGVNAIMSYIENKDPYFERYFTDKYKEAKAELDALNPAIWSGEWEGMKKRES